jgi:hypothetical protein
MILLLGRAANLLVAVKLLVMKRNGATRREAVRWMAAQVACVAVFTVASFFISELLQVLRKLRATR